jgi:hypothetical protein
MEILMGQAQELLELLQKLVLPGAGLAGPFGKGTESSKHDVDVLLEGCEPTEELKVRLVNILRPKSVEDTDWGGVVHERDDIRRRGHILHRQGLRQMRDIIITIPKDTPWHEYEQELKAAEEGAILNFKIPNMPKEQVRRCYVAYCDVVVGYHDVKEVGWKLGFTCSTTGRVWPSGCYVQRTGKFHGVGPVAMKGFQGWRYYGEPINPETDGGG